MARPEGVLLLHGMARTSRSMAKMARSLNTAGFEILNLDYDSRHNRLKQLAEQVGLAILPFVAACSCVHIVTHSMGGLVARVHLAARRPPWLGKVVMLAPPNHGSEIADRLHRSLLYQAAFGPAGQQLTTAAGAALSAELGAVDYPLGIIAGRRWLPSLFLPGPSDGKVTVRSTRLAGMSGHIVVPCTHPWLMRDPAAIAQTIAFIRTGQFVETDRSMRCVQTPPRSSLEGPVLLERPPLRRMIGPSNA